MRNWPYCCIAFGASVLLCCLATGNAASAAPERLADGDITLAVETKLIVEPAVPSHRIDVSTDDGIVTLSGSVDTYTARLDAAEAAASVKGVRAVINEIVVKPIIRTDAQIRGDVISALAFDPLTEAFQIDVSVENGVVTLEGTVDSYAEKIVAEQVAQNVKGVIDVRNIRETGSARENQMSHFDKETNNVIRSEANPHVPGHRVGRAGIRHRLYPPWTGGTHGHGVEFTIKVRRTGGRDGEPGWSIRINRYHRRGGIASKRRDSKRGRGREPADA